MLDATNGDTARQRNDTFTCGARVLDDTLSANQKPLRKQDKLATSSNGRKRRNSGASGTIQPREALPLSLHRSILTTVTYHSPLLKQDFTSWVTSVWNASPRSPHRLIPSSDQTKSCIKIRHMNTKSSASSREEQLIGSAPELYRHYYWEVAQLS